jgi:hypothetical protein
MSNTITIHLLSENPDTIACSPYAERYYSDLFKLKVVVDYHCPENEMVAFNKDQFEISFSIKNIGLMND